MCFAIFDLNEDGYIQRNELLSVLSVASSLNSCSTHEEQEEWTERTCNFIFSRFDSNQDGQLSYDEFLQAAETNPQIMGIFTLEGMAVKKQV